MLAACSDYPTETSDASADPGAQGTGFSVTPEQAHDTRPGERVFRELASEVPSFAGFHFDRAGRMVVRLTDPAQSTALDAALVPVLQRMRAEDGRSDISPMQVVYQDAKYTFAQLSSWRDLIEDVLFELEDVVMLDLDERENNLFIGLATGSGRSVAAAKARAMGVPSDAVVFEVLRRADPGMGAVDPSDLPESIVGCYHLAFECRPLIGGYQIQFARDGGAPIFLCTIGFTALHNWKRVFVTASHCSDDEWNLEYTPYYQNEFPYLVGTESKDPRGTTCGLFWAWKCRASDANLVEPSVDTELGYLARPVQLGSRNVNGRFKIVGQRDAYVGARVYVIGRTTGLHDGWVEKTCTTFDKAPQRFHKVTCADVADYNSSGGDSGGPVFMWNGVSDEVSLVGVNFARVGIYDHAFFSGMSAIQADLGRLEARAAGHQGPPPPPPGPPGPPCGPDEPFCMTSR